MNPFIQLKTIPYPNRFHFALTSVCNLSCPFCWRNRRIFHRKKIEHANDDIIDKWLGMINNNLDVVHPGGGGEALLHPRFGEFIRKVLYIQNSNPKKMPEIMLVTNGTLLGKWPVLLEAFETGNIKIIISMETADPEKYRTFRVGGNLAVLEKNLCDIWQARKKSKHSKPQSRVLINSIMTRGNVEDAAGLVDFAARTGVDGVTFKKLRGYPQSPSRFMSDDAILSTSQLNYLNRIRKMGEDVGVVVNSDFDENRYQEKKWLPCEDIFRSVYLQPDGTVYTCCSIIITEKTSIGNLNKKELGNIWNSRRLKKIRKRIILGKPADICSRCNHRSTLDKQASILRKKYLKNL